MSIDIPKNLYLKPGWCTVQKTERLFKLVEEVKPILIVEFGVFGGRSLIPMALSLKKNGKGEIIGIDAWDKEASITNYDSIDPNYKWWFDVDHKAIFNSFLKSIHEYSINDIVKYYIKRSNEVVDIFEDQSIDILHQDSNHTEKTSSEEVELYYNKVKPGGFWIFDDTDWSTTQKAQDLLLSKGYSIIEDYTSWKIYKRDNYF
jgi:predicted O-methyltransferase YrrM